MAHKQLRQRGPACPSRRTEGEIENTSLSALPSLPSQGFSAPAAVDLGLAAALESLGDNPNILNIVDCERGIAAWETWSARGAGMEMKGQVMAKVMVALWVVGTVAAALLFTARVSSAEEGGGTAPATQPWASSSPADLLQLASQVPGDDPDRKETRQLLAEHVTKTYLVSPDATRSVSCLEWKGFAECLGQDLSAPARAQWVEKILGAYAGSAEDLRKRQTNEIYDVSAAAVTLGAPPATREALVGRIRDVFGAAKVGSMEFDDLTPVCDALNVLGGRLANESLILYTEKSSEWRSFKPGKLACLAWRLDSLGEMTAAKAQLAVAEHITTTCLGSTDTVKAIGLEAWGPLAQMGRNLLAESRQAWAKALKDAFAPTEADLLRLEGLDAARLAWGMEVLDKALAAKLAHDWLMKSNLVKTADRGDVIGLAYKAVNHGTASPAERATIPNRIAELFLSQPEQMADFENCALMVSLWWTVENRSKIQEWTTKAYQCAVGSEDARGRVSMPMLAQLAHWHYHSEMTGPGKAYPAFALALARHAREGTLVATEPQTLGAMLGTPETRQTLRGELIDAQGYPRAGAAKVLAVAYQVSGEGNDWIALVEQKLKDTQNDPEARSRWLLVRAYSEAARSSPPSPLRGRKWLEEAMASSSVRGQALREVVDGHLLYCNYDQALAVLETLGRRFTDAETVETITALQTKVKDAKAQALLDAEKMEACATALFKEEVKRRLVDARARGDTEAIQRCEQALGSGR